MAEVVTDSDGFEWVSKRNCALRPGRLAALLAIPAGASLTIAASFASVGAWWILVFSVIELLGLVAAFIVYARHAGAYERLFLTRDRLVGVDLTNGNIQFEQRWRARQAASVNAATPLVIGDLAAGRDQALRAALAWVDRPVSAPF